MRPGPTAAWTISWTDRWRTTAPAGTCPEWKAPAGCPRTCASAKSVRSGSGTRSASAFPREATPDVGIFRSELGWREFCWQLLYVNPQLATRNYRPEFDRFDWQEPTAAELDAWQQGRTGYPLVDAGMRQLWQTGWMHNRVRMAAASFLVKNLLADWRLGEAWFWDTLVDADAASNPANWQWVAGSGADASPYFRIFNPVTQSKKFDAEGRYLREFIPELAPLDRKAIHEPWKAPGLQGYPAPVVGLPESRERALATYQRLKDNQG